MNNPTLAILALGSNIGDKRANLENAIAALSAHDDITIVAQSEFYRTAPWGETDQDWFANACIKIETRLEPKPLLVVCQSVENAFGRVRTKRWGPRTLDVDILFYGDIETSDPELILPHPRITERAFVLVPLCDVAPEKHVKGRTVAAWCEAMPPEHLNEIVALPSARQPGEQTK